MTTYPSTKTVLNPAVWTPRTGGNYDAGHDLQGYLPANVTATPGTVTITARQEPYPSQWAGDLPHSYTSGRIDTKTKLAITPGSYVEALIIVPDVAGCWAAFWLVGSNEDGSTGVGWPRCGELDVFETRGSSSPGRVWRNIHVADAAGHNVEVGWSDPHAATALDLTRSHYYGVDFDGNGVRFYIDRAVVQTVTRAQLEAKGGVWPFTNTMDVIANVAVGNLGGTPDPTTMPWQMTISDLLVVPVAQRPTGVV